VVKCIFSCLTVNSRVKFHAKMCMHCWNINKSHREGTYVQPLLLSREGVAARGRRLELNVFKRTTIEYKTVRLWSGGLISGAVAFNTDWRRQDRPEDQQALHYHRDAPERPPASGRWLFSTDRQIWRTVGEDRQRTAIRFAPRSRADNTAADEAAVNQPWRGWYLMLMPTCRTRTPRD